VTQSPVDIQSQELQSPPILNAAAGSNGDFALDQNVTYPPYDLHGGDELSAHYSPVANDTMLWQEADTPWLTGWRPPAVEHVQEQTIDMSWTFDPHIFSSVAYQGLRDGGDSPLPLSLKSLQGLSAEELGLIFAQNAF
jgi:hypothetical protein